MFAAFPDLSSSEMREVMALEVIDPTNEQRGDLRTAQLCALVANALGGKKGGGRFSPSEFMPEFGPRDQEKDREAIIAQFKMLQKMKANG